MVSANGLLCLAFYNRLSSLANRSRTMNKERFDLSSHLTAEQVAGEASIEAKHLESRIATLNEIGHQIYSRAKWIRGTLMALLISILCMLSCSLCLAMSGLTPAIGAVAPWLFGLGTLAMMAGVLAAMEELRRTLPPLWYEHEKLDDLL